MKIHKKRGFTVHGSYAWIKTEDGLKGIKWKSQKMLIFCLVR
jgi:hypothetical protein